jgi:hypothetical protein
MLQAAGYPDQKGALTRVASHLDIHPRTLSRWANGEQNPPPDQMVSEKKIELTDYIDEEIQKALGAMNDVRHEASYRDLIVGLGVLIDKKQLLSGEPTSINEERSDTRERLRSKLDSLATRHGAGNVLNLTRTG